MESYVFQKLAYAAVSFGTLVSSNTSAKEQLDKLYEAVDKLSSSVCGSYANKGGSVSGSLEGEYKGELSDILSYIGDANSQANIEGQAEGYIGVLREELAGEIKSVRDCRVRIFESKDL